MAATQNSLQLYMDWHVELCDDQSYSFHSIPPCAPLCNIEHANEKGQLAPRLLHFTCKKYVWL
uniref:Uncharacterized protein n=1 Tax=Arundo donax TaxID=35708 RepID=A0A0A8Y4N2_ARUDO